VTVGKPEGKRSFGRPGCMTEDKMRMNLGKYGRKAWSGCNWLRVGTKRCLLRTR
jgi:hypothetical protein